MSAALIAAAQAALNVLDATGAQTEANALRAALAAAPEQEPVAHTDPLHDDAYLRAIALGFPQGDARRWTLCRIADRIEAAAPAPAPIAQPLTWDQESRGMFVARLENMAQNGHAWLTIAAVLALLNDCDMLASQSAGIGAQEQPQPCVWAQDDEGSEAWHPSCGRGMFSLTDGGPKDNGMKFCCYCGKPVEESPWVEPGDDDGIGAQEPKP